MNILITANDTYFYPASVMITSVMENNRDCRIVFYLMYHDLDQNHRKKLRQIVSRYELCSIEFIFVDKDIFGNAPLEAEINTYVTVEIYFRLAMGELLPKDIDRILYLDVDTIVNKMLQELYHTKLGKGITAAVCDDIGIYMNKKVKKRVWKNLGYREKDRYFNSGVMLIDLNEFRKNYSLKMFCSYIARNKDKLMFHDQDVLNRMLKNKVKYLDYQKFNLRPFYLPYSEKSKARLKSAVIIHYGEKPWEKKFSDMGGELFEEYAVINQDIHGYKSIKRKNREYLKKNKKKIMISRVKRNIMLTVRRITDDRIG